LPELGYTFYVTVQRSLQRLQCNFLRCCASYWWVH